LAYIRSHSGRDTRGGAELPSRSPWRAGSTDQPTCRVDAATTARSRGARTPALSQPCLATGCPLARGRVGARGSARLSRSAPHTLRASVDPLSRPRSNERPGARSCLAKRLALGKPCTTRGSSQPRPIPQNKILRITRITQKNVIDLELCSEGEPKHGSARGVACTRARGDDQARSRRATSRTFDQKSRSELPADSGLSEAVWRA
jgi:hypothetical protein